MAGLETQASSCGSAALSGMPAFSYWGTGTPWGQAAQCASTWSDHRVNVAYPPGASVLLQGFEGRTSHSNQLYDGVNCRILIKF